MNEPSNFCPFPCQDPKAEAEKQGNPPAPPPIREPPRKIPGFPYPKKVGGRSEAPQDNVEAFEVPLEEQIEYEPSPKVEIDHSGDDLLEPEYHIRNAFGALSERTSRTDLKHANGQWEYDVHNVYGTSKRLQCFRIWAYEKI